MGNLQGLLAEGPLEGRWTCRAPEKSRAPAGARPRRTGPVVDWLPSGCTLFTTQIDFVALSDTTSTYERNVNC